MGRLDGVAKEPRAVVSSLNPPPWSGLGLAPLSPRAPAPPPAEEHPSRNVNLAGAGLVALRGPRSIRGKLKRCLTEPDGLEVRPLSHVRIPTGDAAAMTARLRTRRLCAANELGWNTARGTKVLPAIRDAGESWACYFARVGNDPRKQSEARGQGTALLISHERDALLKSKGMPGVERLGRDAYLSKVRHDPAAGIRRAVMRHDLAAVRAALEAGADPNLEVNMGMRGGGVKPLLHVAASHVGTVRTVGDAGLALASGRALRIREEFVHPSVAAPTVKLLLEFGADPDQPDDRGNTALHAAAAKDAADVVLELMNAGADYNAKNEQGQVPFEVAAGKMSKAHLLRSQAETQQLLQARQTLRLCTPRVASRGSKGSRGHTLGTAWFVGQGYEQLTAGHMSLLRDRWEPPTPPSVAARDHRYGSR